MTNLTAGELRAITITAAAKSEIIIMDHSGRQVSITSYTVVYPKAFDEAKQRDVPSGPPVLTLHMGRPS